MKELSLNILDIVENSTKAEADLVSISIFEDDDTLTINITDNGYGMSEETLQSVTDPFYTTRTTRTVGMGIPLFRFAAEQTGGDLKISSTHIDVDKENHGTSITAIFNKTHIDYTPLGDIISTIVTLVQGHPNIDFVFLHNIGSKKVSLDTRELRTVLDDVPLDTFDVLVWIKENLSSQYCCIN